MERGDNVHEHSLGSLDTLKKHNREELIYRVFERENRPMSDREVKDLLGFDEMNAVRPRISEMSKEYDGQPGRLQECGQAKCRKTGKTVRLTRISQRTSGPSFAFRDRA